MRVWRVNLNHTLLCYYKSLHYTICYRLLLILVYDNFSLLILLSMTLSTIYFTNVLLLYIYFLLIDYYYYYYYCRKMMIIILILIYHYYYYEIIIIISIVYFLTSFVIITTSPQLLFRIALASAARRSTRRLEAAAGCANEPDFILTCTFVLPLFVLVSAVTRRLRGATSTIGSSQRDGGISPLPAMSFIVQIFSLLYTYRYIVTLCNVDCGGGHYCASPYHYCTFLMFLLNKCEHAENTQYHVFCIFAHIILPPSLP